MGSVLGSIVTHLVLYMLPKRILSVRKVRIPLHLAETVFLYNMHTMTENIVTDRVNFVIQFHI